MATIVIEVMLNVDRAAAAPARWLIAAALVVPVPIVPVPVVGVPVGAPAVLVVGVPPVLEVGVPPVLVVGVPPVLVVGVPPVVVVGVLVVPVPVTPAVPGRTFGATINVPMTCTFWLTIAARSMPAAGFSR